MILLEQYIELKIYHDNKLRSYNVVELLKDDDGMSFRIYYKGAYIFTLIPTMREFLSFYLSDQDSLINIDWNLYSKIKASLVSIFMKGPSS